MRKLTKWTRRPVLAGLAACAALLAGASATGAATAPSLGTAQSFAVLGGTTVTNTGPTTIGGDLGVSPGSSITGGTTISLTGGVYAADAVALQAQNDVTTAYNALAAAPCTQSFNGTAVEVGGQTLTPGVYCYSSSAQLTGTLTLNAQGDSNAVFIFKTVSTLTTASSSSVAMTNNGQPCNVFWQIGSSATLGTNTAFVGNVLALTSIGLATGATVSGRALARNGAVTMDSNTISSSVCSAGTAPTATSTSTVATATAAAATATAAAATATSAAATATAAIATGTATPVVSTPAATSTPAPAQPAVTPLPPRIVAPPNTGSGPGGHGTDRTPWAAALAALAGGSLVLGLGMRARRTRPHQLRR